MADGGWRMDASDHDDYGIDWLSVSPSNPRKRPFQVSQQVLRVLNPDGKPYQAVANAQRRPTLHRDRRVSHGRGMADQALNTAQRLCQRKDLQVGHDFVRVFPRTDVHGDHSSESSHLPTRQLMLRVRLQARIEHPLGAEPLG